MGRPGDGDGEDSARWRWAAGLGAWWPRHRLAFAAVVGCATAADVFFGEGWNTFAPVLAWAMLLGLHYLFAQSLDVDDDRGRTAHGGSAAPGLRPGSHRRHRRPARPRHRRPPPPLGPRPQLPSLALRRPARRGAARRLPRDPAELSDRGFPSGLGRVAGRRIRVRGGGMGSVRPCRRDGVGGVGRGGVGLPHRRRRPGVARPGGPRGGAGRPGRLRPGPGGCARSRRWPRTRTTWRPMRPAR